MKLNEVEKYQYFTVFFAAVAIILAILLIRAKNPHVTTAVDSAAEALRECSDNLKAWNKKYPSGTEPSIQSQNELVMVLQSCGAKSDAPQT